MLAAILLSALLASVATAHGRAPKLMGGSMFRADLKSRNIFGDIGALEAEAGPVEERSSLIAGAQTKKPRQQSCGPGVGSCAAGYCCSSDGTCGQGKDYCEGPDCQYKYGPACDANTVPAGASTSGIARPQLGSIPYGVRINDCTKPGVVALTFDDGPYLYTSDLLDLLDQYNAKATFFITGNNIGKGEIDNCATGYPAIIQRMYASGHQIASHTWSHQDLVGLSQTYFNNQIYYNEMAFRNILGFFPTYFRPPYVDCDDQCFSRLKAAGYHVIYYDLDTFDYLNDDPNLIQNSKNNFNNYLSQTAPNPATENVLSLSHDTHYQTVYNLTAFMLQTIAAYGYGTSVTVGQCLGDPPANWYRAAGTPSGCTTPPLTVSTEGNCTGGLTCQGSVFGNCCSVYNWCGSTPAYCGTGCQAAFGTCGISSSSSSSLSTSTSSSQMPTSTTASISSSSTSLSLSTSLSSSRGTTSTSSSTTSSTTSSLPSSSSLSTSTSSSKTTSSTSSTTTSSPYTTSSSSSKVTTTTSTSTTPYTTPSSSSSKTTVPTTASSASRTTSSISSSTSGVVVSSNGQCGTGVTCLNSPYGNCCSRYGFCGSDVTHCGAYCQPAYGTCSPLPSSTSTALTVSTEGSCGQGITCLNSAFGNCCSQYGYCGNTAAYCGTGCNKSFGTCT